MKIVETKQPIIRTYGRKQKTKKKNKKKINEANVQ